MPVKIRLTRMGKKKQPTYRVVVIDSRKPRDGKYIEQIGRYDPRQEPSIVEIDNDRALEWLRRGAQPSDTARKLLEISGAWTRFRIAKGDIHTIDEATAVEPVAVEPAAAEVAAEVAEAVAEATDSDTPERVAAVATPDGDDAADVESAEEAPADAGTGSDDQPSDEPEGDEA